MNIPEAYKNGIINPETGETVPFRDFTEALCNQVADVLSTAGIDKTHVVLLITCENDRGQLTVSNTDRATAIGIVSQALLRLTSPERN